MILKVFAILISTIVVTNSVFSQESGEYSRSDLKEKLLQIESPSPEIKDISQSRKNPGIAMLMSFVLPGAGHYYVNKMDVGKYFVIAEGASWLGLLGMNIYGDAMRDDSRKYAVEHAGVTLENKDNDYFSNVGNYNNIYDYNNAKLQRGEYDKVYDVNSFFWNWDSFSSRERFEKQRKSSERIYNSRVIFASTLVVNRIVSGISALILANSSNKNLSGLYINPQITYDKDFNVDGVKLHLGGNFNF